MFTTNKKKLIVLLCIGAITAGVVAFTPDKPQDDFKNLQVLPKDISKEKLDTIMHAFNDALGVKCLYCHVHEGDDWKQGWKMDSDDKPEKGIARHMLRMTMAINSNYFNFENSAKPDTINVVTCNTCHRGIAHPDAKGIAEQMENGGMKTAPPPPPPPPGAPKKEQ